jgi:hypothetical protein
MSNYLRQLKLHKQSLQLSFNDIVSDIEWYEKKLKILDEQKKNAEDLICIANEQIAIESNTE